MLAVPRRGEPPHTTKQKEGLTSSPFFMSMNYYVYILYSFSHSKSYVGSTSDLENRLVLHNTSDNKKSYTYNFRPWIIAHHEKFETKHHALLREKWFKTGVGREYKTKILKTFLTKR